jgi:glycine cleavage system aminomethyltransferase T
MVLAGSRPIDPDAVLTAGAHFIGLGQEANTANDEGWMTSVCHSPLLGHSIGLGFIRRGPARHGERVLAVDPVRGTDIEVEIVSPHFHDPSGERLRA